MRRQWARAVHPMRWVKDETAARNGAPAKDGRRQAERAGRPRNNTRACLEYSIGAGRRQSNRGSRTRKEVSLLARGLEAGSLWKASTKGRAAAPGRDMAKD